MKGWRLALVLIAAAFVVALLVLPSQSFQDCIQGYQPQNSEQSPPERAADFIKIGRRCSASFIEANQAALGALATLFIALFTGTLWWSTRQLWQASENQSKLTHRSIHEAARAASAMEQIAHHSAASADAAIATARHVLVVERAWVFGSPVLEAHDVLPKVYLGLKNHGKTPAFVKVICVGCLSDEPFDPNPTYSFDREQVQVTLSANEAHRHHEAFLFLEPEYLVGYVGYTDIFGNFNVSRFCFRVIRDERRYEMAGHPNWNLHYTEKQS